jgi:hypothetical protein
MLDFISKLFNNNNSIELIIGYCIVIVVFTASILLIYKVAKKNGDRIGIGLEATKKGIGMRFLFIGRHQKDNHTFESDKTKIKPEIIQLQQQQTLSSQIPLTEHIVFFNLNKYIQTDCLNFDDYEPKMKELYGVNEIHTYKVTETKKLIARTFVQECVFTVIRDNFKAFISELVTTEGKNLYHFDEVMFNCVKEYRIKAETVHLELPNGKLLKGIPDVFIDKFLSWDSPHIQIASEKFSNVLHSDFYKTWQFKTIVNLDILDMVANIILIDANRSILSINGELEKAIVNMLDENKQEK